jgi:hypothetical protein
MTQPREANAAVTSAISKAVPRGSMSLESLELWKNIFEISGVVLLLLTFIAGTGALWFSKRVNAIQAEQLKQFDKGLTEAKTELGKQQERAAKAEGDIALSEQHAAEANAKAEGFRLDIAKANESAEQARAQVAGATAEAAKANLELAKLKTPRNLSKEQQNRITLKIAPFPNTPYDLWVSTDSDSTNLLNLIDEAIRIAKWQFHQAGVITFANKAGVIAASGVSIHFAEELRGTLEAPALALANALIAEGIPITGVFRDQKGSEEDKDRTRIHVMIGSKPLN